jgi:transcriptional regulator NrdR family protein
MKCPKCKDRTEVLQTIPSGEFNDRKRQCLNPSCGHRFKTKEKIEGYAPKQITTEGVMQSLNLSKERKGKTGFDAEAVAAAIAVDRRRAQLRREQKQKARAEWEDGRYVDRAPTRLNKQSLRKEIDGY